MKNFNLDRWVGQILSTQEQELSCSDCFDQLSEYVEREFARGEPDPQLRDLQQHLGQCRVCREEYEMLRDLISEQSGDAPSAER